MNVYRFLTAVQELKALPQRDVEEKVNSIWAEFLSPTASNSVNIDSKSMNITKKNMDCPDRWTFDSAAVCYNHILLILYNFKLSILSKVFGYL